MNRNFCYQNMNGQMAPGFWTSPLQAGADPTHQMAAPPGYRQNQHFEVTMIEETGTVAGPSGQQQQGKPPGWPAGHNGNLATPPGFSKARKQRRNQPAGPPLTNFGPSGAGNCQQVLPEGHIMAGFCNQIQAGQMVNFFGHQPGNIVTSPVQAMTAVQQIGSSGGFSGNSQMRNQMFSGMFPQGFSYPQMAMAHGYPYANPGQMSLAAPPGTGGPFAGAFGFPFAAPPNPGTSNSMVYGAPHPRNAQVWAINENLSMPVDMPENPVVDHGMATESNPVLRQLLSTHQMIPQNTRLTQISPLVPTQEAARPVSGHLLLTPGSSHVGNPPNLTAETPHAVSETNINEETKPSDRFSPIIQPFSYMSTEPLIPQEEEYANKQKPEHIAPTTQKVLKKEIKLEVEEEPVMEQGQTEEPVDLSAQAMAPEDEGQQKAPEDKGKNVVDTLTPHTMEQIDSLIDRSMGLLPAGEGEETGSLASVSVTEALRLTSLQKLKSYIDKQVEEKMKIVQMERRVENKGEKAVDLIERNLSEETTEERLEEPHPLEVPQPEKETSEQLDEEMPQSIPQAASTFAFCAKCSNHGRKSSSYLCRRTREDGARVCPYDICDCKPCKKADAMRRYHNKREKKKRSLKRKQTEEADIPMPEEDPQENAENEVNDEEPPLVAGQSSKHNSWLYCAKCRGHGIQNLTKICRQNIRKGRRRCPYDKCRCYYCEEINARRSRINKYLKEKRRMGKEDSSSSDDDY